MDQQPEVITTTVFDLLPLAGYLGVTLIFVAVATLIVVPILYPFIKAKRPFFLWLLQQNIKINLIAAPFLFLKSAFVSGLFFRGFEGVGAFPMYFQSLVESMFSPMLLLGITLWQFVLKFILEVRGEYKKTEPVE